MDTAEDYIYGDVKMSSFSRFQEKMDVLDLIICVLKDHEKNLSDLVDKLDDAYKTSFEKKQQSLTEAIHTGPQESSNSNNIVKCKSWSTFKDLSGDASSITFEMRNGKLSVFSKVDGTSFSYSGKLTPKSAEDILKLLKACPSLISKKSAMPGLP